MKQVTIKTSILKNASLKIGAILGFIYVINVCIDVFYFKASFNDSINTADMWLWYSLISFLLYVVGVCIDEKIIISDINNP